MVKRTLSYYIKHIFLCTNQKAPGKTCCANTGGDLFLEYLKNKLQSMSQHGPGRYRVSKSGCLGRCKLGPCMVIYPEGVWYTYTCEKDIDDIIEQHLLQGKTVSHLLLEAPNNEKV